MRIHAKITNKGEKEMCDKETLNTMVRDYLDIESEIKSKQVVLDGIKDQIKEELEERGVEELSVGSSIVRYRNVLTSIFDKTAFKKKYEELYTLYLRQVQSKKFSIS
jgi:predicted phage-related endonuclease